MFLREKNAEHTELAVRCMMLLGPRQSSHKKTPRRRALTMTKPASEGAGHGRGRHHHHHRKPPLCTEDSPEKPRFRNVKPRVGSQYQTKVPKRGGALLSRPAPVLVSNEIPHLTEDKVHNEESMETGEILLVFWSVLSEERATEGPVLPQRMAASVVYDCC